MSINKQVRVCVCVHGLFSGGHVCVKQTIDALPREEQAALLSGRVVSLSIPSCFHSSRCRTLSARAGTPPDYHHCLSLHGRMRVCAAAPRAGLRAEHAGALNGA